MEGNNQGQGVPTTVAPDVLQTPVAAVAQQPARPKMPRAMRGETPEAFHARYYEWARSEFTAFWHESSAQWRIDYPGIDVGQQCRAALNYLKANPAKRKKNLLAFLTRWLQKAQEQSRNGTPGGFKTPAQQKHENNYNAYQAFMAKPMEDGDEEVGV